MYIYVYVYIYNFYTPRTHTRAYTHMHTHALAYVGLTKLMSGSYKLTRLLAATLVLHATVLCETWSGSIPKETTQSRKGRSISKRRSRKLRRPFTLTGPAAARNLCASAR